MKFNINIDFLFLQLIKKICMFPEENGERVLSENIRNWPKGLKIISWSKKVSIIYMKKIGYATGHVTV
jgi:hypothetical protein